ncbi:class I SAM-dependent methyltransferase [uncultured Methanosphaera sp.]|uniref:class I SAM-dependent methyltransferase n=1 Tax=uncultured Methanosphaera sp. TaxID=262501 RepID=UPI002804AD26|nr:class I SAM-dependent methyltransferase [uncultured Methanosphaera sp.]
MSDLKTHFNETSKHYDNLVKKTIPKYDEMIEALVNSIPEKENLRILDLGCGTGNISLQVLERFPDAKITCLDISDKMIEVAKEKLAGYENIEFVLGDFTIVDIIDDYDAIISSLALHHIRDENDKRQMYQCIYDSLKQDGVFYNADVMEANSKYNSKLNERIADKYMAENQLTVEDMKDHKKKREHNDHPITITDHLRLLEDVGFKEIDVIWKYYSNAVYGGTRKE